MFTRYGTSNVHWPALSSFTCMNDGFNNVCAQDSIHGFNDATVDANLGQHMNALDRAVQERARCISPYVERSDRSKGPVRPVADEKRRRPTNANPGGTPSG